MTFFLKTLFLSISVMSLSVSAVANKLDSAKDVSDATQYGVTRYIPLNISPAFERDLRRLAVLANVSHLVKPYRLNAVLKALDKIETKHPTLHRRLHCRRAVWVKKTDING